jgi:hypothetical protein
MKTILTIALMLVSLNSNAQNQQFTKIYILNPSGAGRPIHLQTANTLNPITIKPRHWAIIKLPVADSLVLAIGKGSYALHFEAGKSYYFVVQTEHIATEVTEKSEREFLLAVHFNSGNGVVRSISGPDEYTLDK